MCKIKSTRVLKHQDKIPPKEGMEIDENTKN